MSVGRICTRYVDLADADESVQAAALRMAERKVGTLVVLDSARRPIGILTDRDLALRVVAAGKDPGQTRVEGVMSPSPRTVSEGTPIEQALAMMRSGSIRRLLVVDQDDALLGLVSLDDILCLLTEELRDVGRLLEREMPAGTPIAPADSGRLTREEITPRGF